jgi:catechol 2,3-dioxygenase-like lactoylglutathione lyase family enzyme
MASRWYSIIVDSHDPATLTRWWAEVLGFQVVFEAADEVAIGKGPDTYPGLVFVTVPDAKTVKNRLHIDLAPDDRDVEVERLVALGAQHVDVGQGDDKTWVVLADPEGNEFCVLSSRESGL